MMTRKHHEFLAALLKGWREDRQSAMCTRHDVFTGPNDVVERVTRFLREDNPRFDSERFWTTVGGK